MSFTSFKKNLIAGILCTTFFASQSQAALIGGAIIHGAMKHASKRDGAIQNSCGNYHMDGVETICSGFGFILIMAGISSAISGGIIPGIVLEENIADVSDNILAEKLGEAIPDLSTSDKLELAKLVKVNKDDAKIVDKINEFLEDNGYSE